MDIVISKDGITFDINNFLELYGIKRFQKLKSHFTISNKNKITNTYIKTYLFKTKLDENKKFFILPKFALNSFYKKGMVKNITSELLSGDSIHTNYIGESNSNQKIVIEYILNNLFPSQNKYFNGCILNMLAGSGKTFLAMDLINKIQKKTLIIVPNKLLLEQWVELLTEFFPNNTIGYLYSTKKKDGDIIVAIINTAASLESFTLLKKHGGNTIIIDDLMQQIGLVIFDEAHLYVSKEFKKVYSRIYSKITIGLTATPIRDDNLHRISELNIGNIINAHELDGYIQKSINYNSLVTFYRYRCLPQYCEYKVRDDGIIDYQSILENIINDEQRNDLIVENIINLSKEKLANVFVFSERRTHVELLFDLLKLKLENINSQDIDYNISIPELEKNIILYGGVKKNVIEEAQNKSNIIFTTYAYSSVGLSIDRFNGLILCTPRKKISSFTQILGRIFRSSSDENNNKKRHIIDIIDYKLPIKNGYRNRLQVYADRDCDIEYIDYHST